jgi:hypothetical protein
MKHKINEDDFMGIFNGNYEGKLFTILHAFIKYSMINCVEKNASNEFQLCVIITLSIVNVSA